MNSISQPNSECNESINILEEVVNYIITQERIPSVIDIETSVGSTISLYSASSSPASTENLAENSSQTPHHDVIHKAHLARLRGEAGKFRALKKCISSGKFNGNDLSERLLGTAMASHPQTSLSSLEGCIPLVIASFLSNAGIEFDSDLLTKSFPSRWKLNDINSDSAVNSLVAMQQEITESGAKVFLSCDKVHRGSFVKNCLILVMRKKALCIGLLMWIILMKQVVIVLLPSGTA